MVVTGFFVLWLLLYAANPLGTIISICFYFVTIVCGGLATSSVNKQIKKCDCQIHYIVLDQVATSAMLCVSSQ